MQSKSLASYFATLKNWFYGLYGKPKCLNCKYNIEEEQSRRTDSTKIQDLLQSYSDQDSVTVRKVDQWSNEIEQRTQKKKKPTKMAKWPLTKKQRQSNGERTAISTSGAGITGHAKNWILEFNLITPFTKVNSR